MGSVVDAGGEREEGEIVESTEYEDISSDEEFTLRMRIEELEARNFELEQIANISGLATNPYELSTGRERVGKENLKYRSRSDEELRTPRRTRRPTAATYTHPVSRRRHMAKGQRPRKRKKRPPSQSSTDSEELLNREHLRMAVNRQSDDMDVIEVPVEIPVITIDDDEEEDVLKLRLEALQSKQELKSDPPEAPEESEEQQLRLIALKSAVVKKHEARKRRKAQEDRPYSPTDDLDCVVVNSPASECNMDISPLESPAVVQENCVAVDMEISSDAPHQEVPQEEKPEESTESEDELTLRELLLAKIQPEKQEKESPEVPEVCLEEDCLRSLLLSSLKKPKVTEETVSLPEKLPETVKVERKSQMLTDLPVIKVPPLIISLRESESESDEMGEAEVEATEVVDNKSPASLVMESPCDSPKPVEEAKEVPTEAFQEKLDEFLKRARTTVEQQTVVPKTTKVVRLPKTPLALSHLPVSSQLEYRRLVVRMNHLERQKKRQLEQKSQPVAKKPAIEADKADKAVLKTSNNIKVVVQNDGVAEASELTVVVRKDEPLRKKVLVKSATSIGLKNGTKSPVKTKKIQPSPPKEEELLEKFLQKISKFSDEKKRKALGAYESHFSNTSASFLEGLDSLLVMVRRVQSEKIEQYRLQDELMKLQKQMRLVEDSLAQQKRVVQRLTPKMTLQHKTILKQRNKCVSLNKMCLKLGQLVKGPKYSLPSDSKRKLMEKFKVLAVETKRLKEIQVTDGTKKMTQEVQEEAKEDAEVEQQKEEEVNGATSSTQCSHNPYKSPLDHMNSQQTANPDAVVCPFDLMGKCEDSECNYSHLNEAQEAR